MSCDMTMHIHHCSFLVSPLPMTEQCFICLFDTNLSLESHFIQMDPGMANVTNQWPSEISNSSSKLCMIFSCINFNKLSAFIQFCFLHIFLHHLPHAIFHFTFLCAIIFSSIFFHSCSIPFSPNNKLSSIQPIHTGKPKWFQSFYNHESGQLLSIPIS